MPELSQSFMNKAGSLPELDRHKLSLSQAGLDSHKTVIGSTTDMERYNQALLHQNTMKDAQSMLHRNGHLKFSFHN